MNDAMNPHDALDAVITLVEMAEYGGPRLDAAIACGIDDRAADRMVIEQVLGTDEFAPATVESLLAGLVPRYTTSLDARIPGENIVLAVCSDRSQRWGAVHRSADGSEHVAWAGTECLARRLAALKGWAAALGLATVTADPEHIDNDNLAGGETDWLGTTALTAPIDTSFDSNDEPADEPAWTIRF